MFLSLSDTHKDTHSKHRIALGNGFHGNGKQRGLTTSHTGLLRSRVSVPKSTEKCTSVRVHTHSLLVLTCEDHR